MITPSSPGVEPSKPSLSTPKDSQRSVEEAGPLCITDIALGYLRRGFSVVPVEPKTKHPCVRWKPYQDRLPTEEEVVAWY